MKTKELHALHENELKEKLVELKKELMKENAQIALGATPKNPGKVGTIKRTIAQIITRLHQKSKSVQPQKVAKKQASATGEVK